VGGNGGNASGAGGMAGVLGHPDPAADYPKYSGFTLALVEEFNAPLDLNADPIWTWSDGGLPEGAVRFTQAGIGFDAGHMVLTVTSAPVPAGQSYAETVPSADTGPVAAKPLQSGELRTRFNNFRYGRYEVRMKPPTATGNFIATMFAFRTPKFTSWREIDIEVTADMPAGVGTNVIFANNRAAWSADIQDFSSTFPAGAGAMPLPAGFANQTDFHTYAFEWLPDRITWFIDGVPVRMKTAGGAVAIPEKSTKVIMNLWIFGTPNGFGGADPSRNTYPMRSQYDWFRFYRWDGETRYPCPTPPACLDPGDLVKSKNNPLDGLAP
jgi:beta-glucanase (GH16 family)